MHGPGPVDHGAHQDVAQDPSQEDDGLEKGPDHGVVGVVVLLWVFVWTGVDANTIFFVVLIFLELTFFHHGQIIP